MPRPRGRPRRKPVTDVQHAALLDLTSRTGVLSRDKLWRAAKERWGVTRRQYTDWLARHPLWQQMHPLPNLKRNTLRSVVVYEPNTYVQVDMGALLPLMASNRGHGYLLVVTDLFSRRVWLEAQKTTSAAETGASFRRILNRSPLLRANLRTVQTDNGGEFTGDFDRALEELRVQHKRGKPGVPQSQGAVESKMGPLRSMIWNRIRHSGNLNWIDRLGEVEHYYNRLPHSTTGVAPAELDKPVAQIDENNLALARRNINKMFQRVDSRRDPNVDKPGQDLDIGSRVRMHIRDKKGMKKSYLPRWSADVFTVTKVHEPRDPDDDVMYSVSGLSGMHARRSLLLVKEPFDVPGFSIDPRRRNVRVRDQREADEIQRDAADYLRNQPIRRPGRGRAAAAAVVPAGLPARWGGAAQGRGRGQLWQLIAQRRAQEAGGGGAAGPAAPNDNRPLPPPGEQPIRTLSPPPEDVGPPNPVYVEPRRFGGRGQRVRDEPDRYNDPDVDRARPQPKRRRRGG
jgi:transposase InsO family protein